MNAHTRFEAQHKAGQAHGRRGHHPRTGRRQAKPPASSTQRDGSSRLGRTATRHKPAREGGREGHPTHTPRNKLTRTQQVGTTAERLAAAGSRDARRHHAHTGVQVRCDVRLLLRAEKRQRQGGHTHTHTQNRGTREPKQTAPPAAGTQHKPNQGHGTTPRHCAAGAQQTGKGQGYKQVVHETRVVRQRHADGLLLRGGRAVAAQVARLAAAVALLRVALRARLGAVAAVQHMQTQGA